jgi:hypothetical protein
MNLRSVAALLLAAFSAVASAQAVMPTFDITGVWSSSGGGTVQIFQQGDNVTMLFVAPDVAHKFVARYVDATTVRGVQIRVVRADGCTTRMGMTYAVESNDLIGVTAVVLESTCGFMEGQVITGFDTRRF